MISCEQMVNLREAARHVPGDPSPAALWRWCRRGILARDGQRIYLEHRRFGGRLFTSVQALDRFGQQLAAADTGPFDVHGDSERTRPDQLHRTTKQRRAAASQALDQLSRQGF